MSTIPLKGTPGYRFLWQHWPSGRAGGLSYYSQYTQVESGLLPSWSRPAAAAPAATAIDRTVAVAAGRAYLDGQLSVLANSANVTVNPDAVAPVINGLNDYYIYLNPTRLLQPVALGDSAPTTYLNGVSIGAGAQYAECIDFGDYLSARAFYEYNGSAWEKFDPAFKAPALPAQPGKNRAWGNEALTAVTGTNFTVDALEKRVYIEPVYPPYTMSNSKALLRDTASLEIGRLSLYYYVLPLSLEVTLTNESTTASVSAESAAILADMVAAAGSAGALAVKLESLDGALLFNSTTPAASANISVISGTSLTLAVDADTSGTYEVLLTPQTPANIYLFAPAKSNLYDVNNVPLLA
jgi:hypothetical protein